MYFLVFVFYFYFLFFYFFSGAVIATTFSILIIISIIGIILLNMTNSAFVRFVSQNANYAGIIILKKVQKVKIEIGLSVLIFMFLPTMYNLTQSVFCKFLISHLFLSFVWVSFGFLLHSFCICFIFSFYFSCIFNFISLVLFHSFLNFFDVSFLLLWCCLSSLTLVDVLL